MVDSVLEVKQIKQLSADGGATVVDIENGNIKLIPQTAPASPSEGQIYYDSSDDTILYYDGNRFKSFSTVSVLNPFNDSSQIAFWKFQDNLNDEHGSYNLTGTSIAYRTGFLGKGMDCTGTNYAQYSSLGVTTNFSVSLRLNFDSVSGTKYIFGDQGSSLGQLYSDTTSGQLKIWRGGEQTWSGSPSISQGTDHHIVLSVSSSTATLYIDNIKYTGSVSMTLGSGYIGTASTAVGNSLYAMNGMIDEIRVFNKALTSGEVSTLYIKDL